MSENDNCGDIEEVFSTTRIEVANEALSQGMRLLAVVKPTIPYASVEYVYGRPKSVQSAVG